MIMSKSKSKSAKSESGAKSDKKEVTIGLTRTATGTTYNTDDVIDYQTYRTTQPKKERKRLISGTDANPNYLRDEYSKRDEHGSKRAIDNNKSLLNYYFAPDNVRSLSAAANTGNSNSSNYTNRSKIASTANKSKTKTLTAEDVRKQREDDEYYVKICNTAGACASAVVTGAVLTKKLGLWGGKKRKTRLNRNTRFNRKTRKLI